MEFKFNVSEIFKGPIVEINQSLIPPGFSGDRRALWDAVTKVSEVVDSMGDASAAAQGLTKPITTADRLRNADQTIYLLVDKNAKNGKGVVTGMLKTGKKSLYVFDRDGQHFQVSPPCVLDFYVHESRQRTGLGKQLFEHMLQKEQVEPVKLAVDRPSEKLLSFLDKHYGLNNAMPQMNNYVVFDGFFPELKNKELNGDSSNSSSPSKTKANGLQQNFTSSPYGRYGAPRPPCSMGQIIHNQSPVQSNEPSGASLNIKSPQSPKGTMQSTPVMQQQQQDYSTAPQAHVCQSAPNMCQHQQQMTNPNNGPQIMPYYGQPNEMQQQQMYMQQQQPMSHQTNLQQQWQPQSQPNLQQQRNIQSQPCIQQQPYIPQQPYIQQQSYTQQQPYMQQQDMQPQQPYIQQQPDIQQQASYVPQSFIQQPNLQQQQLNMQPPLPIQQPNAIQPQYVPVEPQQPNIYEQQPYMAGLHQQQLQLNMQRPPQKLRNGMSPRLDLNSKGSEEEQSSYFPLESEQFSSDNVQPSKQMVSEPNLRSQQYTQYPQHVPQPQFMVQSQQNLTGSTPPQQFIQQPSTPRSQRYNLQFAQPMQAQQNAVLQTTQQSVPNMPSPKQAVPQRSSPELQTNQPANTVPQRQYIQPPNTEHPVQINTNEGYAQPPQAQYHYYDSSAGVMQKQFTHGNASQSASNAPNLNAAGDMPTLQKSPEYCGQQINTARPAAGHITNNGPSQMQFQAPCHEVYQQQPASTILNQDQSGQVSAQMLPQQSQLMTGEPHKPHEESVSQSPKLERPRSLSIQRSEESDNLDKKMLTDIKSEAHSDAKPVKDQLDNIENDLEKVEITESVPQLDAPLSAANNNANDSDDSENRSKSPNPLTAQGFFDLKFYHSRLW